MITSNYASSNNLSSAPTRTNGPVLENQQTSERAPEDAKQWELQSYLGDANQDVQTLKNSSETWQEPPFYQLTLCLGSGTKAYEIKAHVMKTSEQVSYPPMAAAQQSRIYQVNIVSDELAKDFPELVGRPLTLDMAQGIDSRMGVYMGLQCLLTDAESNRGTIGHEPRTGAQVVNGPEGYETHPVGGKDGIEIPRFKFPQN